VKNLLSISAFYLTLALFSPQSSLASTGESCSRVFAMTSEISPSSQTDLLFAALPSVSPRLWKRYWDHPDVDMIFQKILSDTQGNTNTIYLPSGDWIMARALLMDKYLFLDLVHIQHKVDSSSIRVGGRSEGANSLLLKTLAAYAKTVNHYASESLITDAYIRGVNIKNPMLKEFLSENGFKRNDLHVYSVEMEKHLKF
jgi:hypothetical protein